MFQQAVITLLPGIKCVCCWFDISCYFSAAVLCTSPPNHLQLLKREVQLQQSDFYVFKWEFEEGGNSIGITISNYLVLPSLIYCTIRPMCETLHHCCCLFYGLC